jgi:hypothetical protein
MKKLLIIKKNRIMIIAGKGKAVEVEKNLQIDNSALLEIKSNNAFVKYEIRKKEFYKANIIEKEAIEKLGKGSWNIRIKYDGKAEAEQETKIELVVYEHK